MMNSTMDLRTWLDSFVRARGGRELPDGRPLYAWRCTDIEYEELRTLMRTQFAVVERRGRFVERDTVKLVRLYAALCLYAAEAWRRTHEGGRWRWQTVLAEVGVADGWLKRHYQVLIGAIGIGLEYWQRPLLQLNGTHEYLLTVACEGGLPLRLLEHNGTRLRAYFLSLQDEARRRRLDDAAALACLASQLRDRLPPSLRQEVVFQLAGRLIAAVEILQQAVAGAADPVVWLDSERPAWRDELPLILADGPLRALLGCLLARPAAAPVAALRWTCSLEGCDGAIGTLVRRLALPPTVTGSTLTNWLRDGDGGTEAANLLPRYRLLIEHNGGTAPIALVTRLRGSGHEAVYRLELTAHVPEVRASDASARMPELYLLAGGSKPLPVAGGDELPELPWVFVEPTVSGEAEWLGAGAVRVRAPSTLVALPVGYAVTGTGIEAVGRLTAPARELRRVAGELHWRSPDGEIGRVLCADPQAGREDWRLCGPTLAEARNAQPVYLGLPRLQCAGEDGGWTNASGSLEWRSTTPGAEWRRDPVGCRGRVQVRWRDADGELRFRSTINVLPAMATLRFAGSSVWLDGLGYGLDARPVSTSGAEVCVVVGDGGLECRCTVTTDSLPPLLFEVDLDWSAAERLTLALPFPLQGGVFTYLGAVQRNDVVVTAGRLGAVTLEVQGGGPFLLEGELSAEGCDADLQHLLWFRHSIPLIAGGRGRVNLEEFGDAIDRLFGATQSLDAVVRLQLLGKGQQPLARLQVARFGWRLEPDDARLTVRLLSGDGGAADAALAQRLILEALPLWEPERQPVPIDAAQPGVWRVAEALTEPGPWLLIARDGDWCCVRPRLWTVRAIAAPAAELAEHEIGAEAAADSFAAVVRSPDGLRAARYTDLYSAMAGNPAHPAWPAVEALLALGHELPPSTFDACRHLVAAPATLVTALLRATDANFNTIWSLAEALPFEWTLLPVADWHAAAVACHARYAALAGTPLADTLLGDFCIRLATRGPVPEVIADWLRRELLSKTEAGSCLSLAASAAGARQVPQLIAHEERTLRQTRADGTWPDAPRVLEAVETLRLPRRHADDKDRRAVLCAPFVAATIARHGTPCSPALRYELRRLRDFDSDWFERACALTLCLELAAFHPARPDATA